MHRIIYSMVCLLLIGLYLFSCSKTDEDNGATAPFPLEKVKSFQSIIKAGTIPSDLVDYNDISEEIFSNYTTGAMVIPRYVKETVSGTGDGSSWDNAANDIRALLNGINDAGANKVYVVLMASGTYILNDSYVMKNHVALVGGFVAGSYDRAGETCLDGNNDERVFDNNDLDRTALLYGVVVTNGNKFQGSGMYNNNSSPTLNNVTFSGNRADYHGGGMYNDFSSPTLINVTFSGNTANHDSGGGMANWDHSSPTLINVTFSGNTAPIGGGMNNNNSSPILINVTFSGNTANHGSGGGMWNSSSSPTLRNVTFTDNISSLGGGMYNQASSSLTLINVTFSDNMAHSWGGGMYNKDSSPP